MNYFIAIVLKEDSILQDEAHLKINYLLKPLYFLPLGISIIEDGSDGITMELEMQWDGNPNIVLAIKTYLGVALPVQVTQLFLN